MSFIIRNKTAAAIPLIDLGLTVPASGDYDLIPEDPRQIAMSADLLTQVVAGNIVALDPLDGVTELSAAITQELVEVHNDPHYRIRGGALDQLDDVDTAGAQGGCLLTCTLVGSPPEEQWVAGPASSVIGDNVLLGDLVDVNAPVETGGSPLGPVGTWGDGEVYVIVGNSSNEVDILPLFGGSPETPIPGFCEAVQDIAGPMVAGGTQTDITVTYVDGVGTCDGAVNFSIDDSFLRNTGDVLDSGTLQIASGATLDLPTGSTITIADGATASIVTPTGGFDGDTDIVNKFYVDSIAAGLDWKESVRAGTVSAITGAVYVPAGGTGGSGAFTGVDLTSDAIFDGAHTITGGLTVGDRILIKDQADAKQNGIYVVTTAGASGALERAHDQDGTPTSEVSGGNTAYVENGTTQEATIWSVIWDGEIALNTDNVDWSQTGATTDLLAGEGLNSVANAFNLDISALSTTATIDGADFIAFDDISASSGTTDTSKTTVTNFLSDLDIVNGINTDGIIIRNGDDTYSSISIAASTAIDLLGIDVTNGDGTSGNPTIGLDIDGLTLRAAIDSSDKVAVYDVTTGTNVHYTVSDIAGAIASTNSFQTWAGGGNTSGDASIIADSSTDTATLSGGDGINVAVNAGADTLTLSIDLSTVPNAGSPGVIDPTDEIIINNGGTTVAITLQDLMDELDLAGDELVKVSANDTTAGYLNGKLVEGTYTSFTENNDAGNETLTIDVDPTTINITDLGDVSGTPSTGDILVYGGSPGSWTAQAPSADFDVCTLTDGTVGTLATDDTIAVCDGGSTVKFTFAEVFETLDVVSGVTGSGMIVKTGGSPDSYATRTITAAGVGAGDGLAVTDGDGIAGNPTVELDIDGTPAAAEDMAATDQFVAYNVSATANETLTGQEVADGVATILGLDSLSVKIIGGSGSPGESQLFITDPTRSKDLSVAEFTSTFSENTIGNNDWFEIGGANNAQTGYVLPYNATLVRVAVHAANANNNKTVDLYVDGTATAPLVTVPSGADSDITDGTLNIDIAAGQKVRLRGGATGGQMQDVVATLWFRWRA